MYVHDATEMAYKHGYEKGYEKGYEDCKAEYEALEKKVKELEKSNRNWRRKTQRLRNKDC